MSNAEYVTAFLGQMVWVRSGDTWRQGYIAHWGNATGRITVKGDNWEVSAMAREIHVECPDDAIREVLVS